jgi:GTP cyclohydrolase II
VNVVGRVPVIIPPNPFSAGYLEAKRRRMAHELPVQHEQDEQDVPASVESNAASAE